METQIFYWTGCLVVWILCASFIGCVIAATIAAPIKVYHFVKKRLWQWKVGADIGYTGFTISDIRFILNNYGGTPKDVPVKDMLKWYKGVKDRVKAIPK